MAGPSGSKPTLTIPVTFDGMDALRELRRLEEAGGDAGDKTKEGMDVASAAAKGLGSELTSIIGIAGGFGVIGQAVGVMNDQMRSAAEYTKRVAGGFQEIQAALRIVATFKGDKPTEEFTLEQAKAGAAAGLTPQQWMEFQKQYQGFAGQFIGEVGKDPSAKIGKDQSADLEKRAAAFMSARGIDASAGGAIFGELLQQAKPGVSNDDLMTQFGQAYTVLEKAKGDPAQLLGQMGQVTAAGVDTGTGAKLLRAMAQRDPGDAGTHARALLKGFSTLKGDEAKELGITDDMDVFAKVEAVAKTMEKQGIAPKSGAEEKFLRKRFNNVQEYDAITAAINFGSRGGLFAAADREAGDVTARTDVDAVDEFKRGKLGARLYEQSAKGAAEMERGQAFSGVEDAKLRAARELTQETDAQGRNVFQRTEWADLLRGTVGRGLGQGTRDEQLVQRRARQDLEGQLSPEEVARARSETSGLATGTMGLDMNVYLKRLVELTEEHKKVAERAGDKALSAPPPRSGPEAHRPG